MSKHEFHPLVKQLLDGDITLADLPAELRAEGEEALRLLARGAYGRYDAGGHLARHGSAGTPASPFPAVAARAGARGRRRARPLAPSGEPPAVRPGCHRAVCPRGAGSETGEPRGHLQPVGFALHTAGPHGPDRRLDSYPHAPGGTTPVRLRRRWRPVGPRPWGSGCG